MFVLLDQIQPTDITEEGAAIIDISFRALSLKDVKNSKKPPYSLSIIFSNLSHLPSTDFRNTTLHIYAPITQRDDQNLIGLTDHREVELDVSRRRVPVVDAAAVDVLVLKERQRADEGTIRE